MSITILTKISIHVILLSNYLGSGILNFYNGNPVMMNRKEIKMDELDQKLINELESRGFQKSSELAQLLDVGERTVRRRINFIRKKGLIKIIAVPNPVFLGYRGWANIGIKVEPGSVNHVALKLIEHPAIYFVASAVGTFDFIIAVRFSTFNELSYFVNSELTEIKGIQNTETILLIQPRKYYNFSWPASRYMNIKDGFENYSDNTSDYNYRIDDLDRKMLNILMEDGLIRPAALASKLSIGESTIRKHLKNMSRNEVFKIEVVPNMNVLEYDAWAVMGINIKYRSAHEVLDDIITHPAVPLASVSLGRFNLMLAARFDTLNSLNHFIQMELPVIEGISSVETFLFNKPLKYHNTIGAHGKLLPINQA